MDEYFNRLVERIYDSVIAPEHHDEVLSEVLRATGSHFMLVSAFRPGEQEPITPRFVGEISSRMLDGIADYAAGASQSDPTVAFLTANPGGGVFATDVYLSRDSHAAHPYIKWNKHYLGNAHWSARFEAKGGALFGASLHTCSPDEPHSAQERRTFELLFKHMARAWRLATRPPDLASRKEALAVVSCTGQLIEMSPALEALVEAADGLTIRSGELLPAERRSWSRWRDAVRQVTWRRTHEEEALLLARPGGAHPLVAIVTATPIGPGFASYSHDALIRIVDRAAVPVDVAATAMRLWGLTMAEARLVRTLVANDFALRDAAEHLHVTYATVRTQLASVFAKTDTNGQPELMRLMTRLSG